MAGRVAGSIGRRRTLIAGGLIFVAGSVWCALSSSATELAAARTFLGVAVGAVSIVSPMYISEITPAAVRGRMVSLNTLMIVVGQLLVFVPGVIVLQIATGESWSWCLHYGFTVFIYGGLVKAAIGAAVLPSAWRLTRRFER